jgi:hypothetical protein
LAAPPFLTLVARTAGLSLPARTFFLAPTLDEEALVPEDVLLAIRIGFCGATGLCLGGGMALDSKLDALRKVEEIFGFLFKEGASLWVFISPSASDVALVCFPLSRASSGSDTRMGIGMEIGMFSAPFATGREPTLVSPEPPAFLFRATGCNPWDFLLPLDRELPRELAPPLEELVIATLWIGGLFRVLVAWLLGNSRVPRMFLGTRRVGSMSGMGKGGGTSKEVPAGNVTGEGKSGDTGVSISSLSDPSPVLSESPPPRVDRVVDALRPLDPLGTGLI